jgi:hypothetical protein
MEHFRIHNYDDDWDEKDNPATAYSYPSDCLDFIPLRVNGRLHYASTPRESEAIPITVWVAEPKRVGVIDELPTGATNLQGVYA